MTKYEYLEIKFNNRNQVDDKIASGLYIVGHTSRNIGPNFSKLGSNTLSPLKIYILAHKIHPVAPKPYHVAPKFLTYYPKLGPLETIRFQVFCMYGL